MIDKLHKKLLEHMSAASDLLDTLEDDGERRFVAGKINGLIIACNALQEVSLEGARERQAEAGAHSR
jgi:hypothetical protein